jgi:hypothetical protein
MDETLSLEWSYTPVDFFEAPVDYSRPTYQAHIEAGRVIVTFAGNQSDSVFPVTHKEVVAFFRGAQPFRNKRFDLSGYNVVRKGPDGSVVVNVSAHLTVHAQVGFADIVARDPAGKVTFDSKLERIKATEHAARLALKHATDPVAASVLKSYDAGINDSSNELTHLYEIRDALAKKFGRDNKACSQLAINKTRWSRLGQLANDEPLRQGRHRGRKLGFLRDATEAELNEARALAWEMIRKYLEWLP